MSAINLSNRSRWMGGFVQYANPIPPGPHAYGPPPYGIWPTSVERPIDPNGAPVAPSTIAAQQEAARKREEDREKALFIEKKNIGQAGLPASTPLPAGAAAAQGAATSLLPRPVDKTMLYGGIVIAIVGVGTRLFASEKTTSQALASGAAIIGGAGLVYKGLQG